MGSHAKVVITDYDGRSHNYVRFLDGYPGTADGFFGNFPRGSHSYRLDTFVRRLTLKERNDVDRLDYSYAYNIDLVERTVSIDSCDHTPVVKYSFEEAIKTYAYPDYCEEHPGSPSLSDAENTLFEVLFPLILKIINKAVSFPHLSRHYEPLGVILCEDVNTYRFQPWTYNLYYFEELTIDAMSDLCKIVFLKKVKDTRSNKEISFAYRIFLDEERFSLPCLNESFRYNQTIPSSVLEEEANLAAERIAIFVTFIPGNLWSNPSYRVSFFSSKYTFHRPTNKNTDVKFSGSRSFGENPTFRGQFKIGGSRKRIAD